MIVRAARFIPCAALASLACSALGLGTLDTRLHAQTPPVAATAPPPPAEPPLQWHDITQWGIEGRAWPELERKRWFDRFPALAEGTVTPTVWSLSRHSAGMLVRFRTNADVIWANYTLFSDRIAQPNMTAIGMSGLAVNVAMSVPFNSIWTTVNGLSDTRPDSAQREAMRALVRRGLEAGAFGVSAGLDYKPAYFATVAEVVNVLSVARPWRTFFINHDRLTPESGYSSLVGMQETMAVRFGASLVPVFTHMKLQGRSQGNAARMLDTMHAESQRNHWVAGDVYPYLSGQTMLASLIIPGWAQDGGVEKMRARFADPAQRARIIREADEAIAARFTGAAGILLGDDGSSLQQYMITTQITSAGEAVVRILETRMPSAILGFGAEADLIRLIADPDIAIACDCGAASGRVSHPRYFGTFPRVLGRYVREQRVLSMEAAIRKMTWLPASLMGLVDRGLVTPGMAADLVIFDSATVMDHATYTNPTAVSTGIVHVVVNGRLALRDGVPTGMQAGQTLAHPTEGISRPAQLLMQTDTERPFVVVYDDHDPRQAGRMAVSVWLDGQYATRALPR